MIDYMPTASFREIFLWIFLPTDAMNMRTKFDVRSFIYSRTHTKIALHSVYSSTGSSIWQLHWHLAAIVAGPTWLRPLGASPDVWAPSVSARRQLAIRRIVYACTAAVGLQATNYDVAVVALYSIIAL